MELIPAIASRVSVRKFKDQPVSEELISTMLEAARQAPSGRNTQPWRFIVIQSSDLREKLTMASNNQKWMMQAPVFIACVADLEARLGKTDCYIDETCPRPETKLIIRDTAIAVEHLVLQAESLGLSTCWVADFAQSDIRPLLGIPNDKYLQAVVVVGYAAHKKPTRTRKPLGEIVYQEYWGHSG